MFLVFFFFFFSSRRRHTRSLCDWSSDVCSSDLDVTRVERSIQQRLEPAPRDDHRAPPANCARNRTSLSNNSRMSGMPWRVMRSEERRVGKECRARGWAEESREQEQKDE